MEKIIKVPDNWMWLDKFEKLYPGKSGSNQNGTWVQAPFYNWPTFGTNVVLNIKDCPCCGSDEIHVQRRVKDSPSVHGPHHTAWKLKCKNCGITTGQYKESETLEKIWNNRGTDTCVCDKFRPNVDKIDRLMYITSTPKDTTSIEFFKYCPYCGELVPSRKEKKR